MTSSAAGIPAWNSASVLSPIRPNAPGSSPDRSPYLVDLAVLYDRFATSPGRMAILDGLLRFRADLHAADPASHGKGPYLERLAIHHRRSAVLAADAIVSFLHNAYLDAQLDSTSSREPWERFADFALFAAGR